MLRILKYFKWYYYIVIILIVLLVYIQVSCDLTLADYIQKIVDMLLAKNTDRNVLGRVALEMAGISVGSILARASTSYLAVRMAADFSRRLRKMIFEKVDSFSMEEINSFSTASLITRTTNDVQQVQQVVMIGLNMAITAPIMAIRGIGMVLGFSTEITSIIAVGIVAIVLMVNVIFVVVIPKFKKIQKLIDRLNLVTRENLTGIRVIRAYNGEQYQEEKFGEVNDEVTKTNIFVNRAMSLIDPFMFFTLNMVNLLIIWIGAYLLSNGSLGDMSVGLGRLTSYTMYTMQIIFSFMMLTFLFILIPRGSVSANRIMEVLNKNVKVSDPISNTPSTDLKGAIEFKDVCFKYPHAETCVIENINLSIKQGETVAFVGSTGSGKSTLINLIPRFYDVTMGELLVNGVNVKDFKLKDLRSLIGYVPQQGILFSGTIASNLSIGENEIPKDKMMEAIKVAQAEEFVSKLELGLESPIAQGGTNVSGGQKQRLSIARAIVNNPEIYIFDDSIAPGEAFCG
ncbi:TPA: ABC transporter ATP-binding protein [bacterium]|nr:ABC transporter ATP-binding protein [bacterium]